MKWVLSGSPTVVNKNADNLCRWMVLLPGGFHVGKQGIIPLLREFFCGSGMEELLTYSGLSPSVQKVFMKFEQYRATRKFLIQMM